MNIFNILPGNKSGQKEETYNYIKLPSVKKYT